MMDTILCKGGPLNGETRYVANLTRDGQLADRFYTHMGKEGELEKWGVYVLAGGLYEFFGQRMGKGYTVIHGPNTAEEAA